jgi:hypothetical protein
MSTRPNRRPTMKIAVPAIERVLLRIKDQIPSGAAKREHYRRTVGGVS